MSNDFDEFPERTAAQQAKIAGDISDRIEREILRFHTPLRREVRRIVRSSPRLADLLTVFPGMLVALATRRGPSANRLNAVAMIESGTQLKAVAKALDLPMWLKRLPPEALTALPADLPRSEGFGRRIACRIPRSTAESAFWLNSILFAGQAAHEDFAVWLARQQVFADGGNCERLFAILAAYCWFSGHSEHAAHKLIVVPWRPEIAFDTALCAAKSWFNRVRLVTQLPEGVLTDPWLRAGSCAGYTFEPLLNHVAILSEAQHMQNCADQYAERLVRDRCRLFSIAKNNVRIATLEIGPHQREAGVLCINQLKSRHNMPASTEVWQAAYAWMATQNALKRLPGAAPAERFFDQGAWKALLDPYRTAKGGAPWFDEEPNHLMFAGFDAELADLARRGGVSSWLFT